MKINVTKDGFIQGDEKIKTPAEMDDAKKQGVRKMMQDSLDSTSTEDQRSDLLIKILRDDGFQLIYDSERSSYKKQVSERYKEFGLSGPLV